MAAEHIARRTCALLLILGALLGLCSSCGDSHRTAQSGGGLASLKDTPAPQGVDPALWEKLTAELARVLAANGKGRGVSGAATGKGSVPGSFWLASDGGTGADSSWYYRNQGDYDFNGEVNIADLTQIGLAFGRSSLEPNWEDVQRVDGDGNGEINIADITPMGQNFGAFVAGHLVETSPTGAAPWTPVAWLPYSAPPPGTESAPRLSQNIASPGAADYYRVTSTANAAEPYQFGASSQAVQWGSVSESGWNQQSGGPQHLGQSSVAGPADKDFAWEFPVQGVSIMFFLGGSPVSDHFGTTYLSTYTATTTGSSIVDTTGYMYAVDREGKQVFGRAFASGFISQPIVLPNQTVVANDILGKIWCLTRDGSVLWTQQVAGINGDNVSTLGPICSSTGNIYLTDESPAIYKIAPDGHIVWSTPLTARATCSPCLIDGTRVCVGVEAEGANPTRIYEFLTIDGAPAGFFDTPNDVKHQIVAQTGEFIMYYDESDEINAIPTGILAPWTFADPGLHTGPSVTTSSDRVVGLGTGSQFSLMTGMLIGLDDFGMQIWNRPLPAGILTEPLVDVDDRIYVSTLGGPDGCGIYAINAASHDIDWFFPSSGYNSGLCLAGEGLITFVTTDTPVSDSLSFEDSHFRLVAIGTP